MEGLLLLITVLPEKSRKDIINLFRYKAGYYILYPFIFLQMNQTLRWSICVYRNTYESSFIIGKCLCSDYSPIDIKSQSKAPSVPPLSTLSTSKISSTSISLLASDCLSNTGPLEYLRIEHEILYCFHNACKNRKNVVKYVIIMTIKTIIYFKYNLK